YGNLLNLLEKHDIYPPSSCREGTCMSCSTPMPSGAVSYDPEPFGEPFEGEILLCCARPETDIELDL
ncbi:2Fe-2S iron-sulfur cluster-binding protein, partial [Dyadobacter sp. SG02]|uniref:2Fe-2S iron-sulfur cluster-binding protein n=1 Tax=Dyadobacter sp. SG02 TaxID=1855291 RepID=UPI00116003B9